MIKLDLLPSLVGYDRMKPPKHGTPTVTQHPKREDDAILKDIAWFVGI